MLNNDDFYANFGYMKLANLLPMMISEVSATATVACYNANAATNAPASPAYMNGGTATAGTAGLLNYLKNNGIGVVGWAMDYPNSLVPNPALAADEISATPTSPRLDYSNWDGCYGAPAGPGLDFQQYFLFGVVTSSD